MKQTVISETLVDVLLNYLASRNINPAGLRTLYPVLPSEADELPQWVPLSSFFQLFRNAAELTGDEDIGLYVMKNTELAELGLLGYACSSAGSVGQAVDVSIRYRGLLQNHTEFSVERIEDGRLAYSYRILDKSLPICRYDNDLALSALVYLVRKVSGMTEWRPKMVYFTHSAPDDLSAYQRTFDCPLEFEASVCTVVFEDDLNNLSVRRGDSRLFLILEGVLKRLYDESVGSMSTLSEVRVAMAERFRNGVPSIDDIASQLGISRRTLQRRLNEAGQTYKELIDDTRMQLAIRYLESSNYPLVEIAFLLGYSELSAFNRAFRRWTGTTPQRYRVTNLS